MFTYASILTGVVNKILKTFEGGKDSKLKNSQTYLRGILVSFIRVKKREISSQSFC